MERLRTKGVSIELVPVEFGCFREDDEGFSGEGDELQVHRAGVTVLERKEVEGKVGSYQFVRGYGKELVEGLHDDSGNESVSVNIILKFAS